MIKRIWVADVKRIYSVHVGAGVLRDPGLLDGAVCAPFQDVFGYEPYPTLAQKGGKLLDGIQRVQAYSDGNKRLAWLSTVAFLQLNGQVVGEVEQAEVDRLVRSLPDAPNPELMAASWLNDRLLGLS